MPLPLHSHPPEPSPSPSLPSPAEIRECFQSLKPLCVRIMDYQTQLRMTPQSGRQYDALYQTLSSLLSLSLALPQAPLLACFDYVLFPLTQLLSQFRAVTHADADIVPGAKHEEQCYVLSFAVLSHLCRLSSQSRSLARIASKVLGDGRGYQALVSIVSKPLNVSGKSVSDELVHASVDALTHLYSAVTMQLSLTLNGSDSDSESGSDLVLTVFSPTSHISVGYIITQLLSVIKHSKHRPNRTSACHCLGAVVGMLSLTRQGVLMATSYLPGSMSALYSVIVNDDKAGRTVLTAAIELLTSMIVVVMTDDAVKQLATNYQQKKKDKKLQQSFTPSPTESASEEQKADEKSHATTTSMKQLNQLQSMIHSVNMQKRSSLPSSVTIISASDFDRYGFATSLTFKSTNNQSVSSAELLIDRNERWFTDTAERLTVLLTDIYQSANIATAHPSAIIATIHSCRTVIQRLYAVLPECLLACLEFILAASQSTASDDVANTAELCLSSRAVSGLLSVSMIDTLIVQRLRQLMLSVARVLRSSSVPATLKLLHTIAGYLALLGTHADSDSDRNLLYEFFTTNENFPELFVCLCQALAVDRQDIHVLEKGNATNSTALNASDSNGSYYQTRFQYAATDEVRDALLRIPFTIGARMGGRIGEIIDALLSFLPSMNTPSDSGSGTGTVKIVDSSALFVLINTIITGITHRYQSSLPPSLLPYIQLALDAYLSSPLLLLTPYDYATHTELQSNALTVSLLVRGAGDVAVCLGRSHFLPYIRQYLFDLLCLLGSPSLLVHQSSLTTLTRMVRLTNNNNDIGAFVLQYSDYIVDRIAAHLRMDDDHHSRSDDRDSDRNTRRQRAWTLPHLLSALLDSPQSMIPVAELIDVLALIIDKLNRSLIAHTHSGSDSDSEDWRCAYLQSLLSVTRAVRRYYAVKPPPQHPLLTSSLYQSSSALSLTKSKLLTGTVDDYYSGANIAARIASKRSQWKQSFDVATEQSAARESPQEFFAKLAAKHERQEQRKAMGLTEEFDSGSDSDSDELKESKRQYDEWRRKDREAESVQPTPEQSAIIAIMTQARAFLATPSLRQRRLVFELIESGIVVLATIPKELFPILARLWPAFVLAFKLPSQIPASSGSDSESSLTVLAALTALECMCSHASKFLAQRFYGEVWPQLRVSLAQHSRQLLTLVSMKSVSVASSLHCKVVRSILLSLSALFDWPDLLQPFVREVVLPLTESLSARLPESVQAAAIQAMRKCALIDAEVTVWALLQRCPHANISDDNCNKAVRVLDWYYIVDNWLDRDDRLALHYERAIQGAHTHARADRGACAEFEANVAVLQREIAAMPESRLLGAH